MWAFKSDDIDIEMVHLKLAFGVLSIGVLMLVFDFKLDHNEGEVKGCIP